MQSLSPRFLRGRNVSRPGKSNHVEVGVPDTDRLLVRFAVQPGNQPRRDLDRFEAPEAFFIGAFPDHYGSRSSRAVEPHEGHRIEENSVIQIVFHKDWIRLDHIINAGEDHPRLLDVEDIAQGRTSDEV